MAVIKMKPTFARPRGRGEVTRDHLYKGEGYAPLLEPQFQKAGRNNNGRITTATRAVAIGTTTAWWTLSATRMAFRPRSSASSTTRTARPTSPWCATPTASVATSLPAWPRGRRHADERLRKRRSASATRCRSATSRWVRPSTASRSPAPARRSPVRPARLGHAAGARRHLRPGSHAFRRSPQGPHRVPRHHR